MKVLLEDAGHAREYVHFDDINVRLIREGDPAPTLRRTGRARTEIDHAKAKRKGFQFIGSIDMTVALLWHEQYGVDIWDDSPEMNARLLRLLNDRDWRLFKATDDTL